jgi:glycosyltransferase involved in cell wall biosynthesis
MLVRSLAGACDAAGVELYVLCEHGGNCANGLPTARTAPVAACRYFRGEQRLRLFFGLPDKSALLHVVRKLRISVLLPARVLPFRSRRFKTIGWIPDFQHVYLPEFFSQTTREYRDQTFRSLAEGCTLVMLSSHNALEHFAAFAPEYRHKARAVPFPSPFAFERLEENVFATQEKFKLPSKFALVANQFWRHNNHELVIDAIRQLRHRDLRLHVVITGLPADYRDPNNETTSRILQSIASAGLWSEITVLGMVSDPDLANLMRAAAVVIQPSRFEGWSTVVQECKSLGRPLICSDIPSHREQAPNALGFVPCDRSDVLADLLGHSWPSLRPGPDLATEERALAAEREFARRHGDTLLQLCHEAVDA